MVFEAIRRQLGRTVPFARLLSIEVESVDGRHALTHMGARPDLCNHIGTMHAGALFTVCEAASGAALAGAMAEVIMRTRFVVRDARVEYLKPAKGDVRAKAGLADDAQAILESLQRDGRADVAVDVSAVTDGDDGLETQVARATFNWHLRMQPK